MSDQDHFILGIISADDPSATLSAELHAHLELHDSEKRAPSFTHHDRRYTLLSHAVDDPDGVERVLMWADGLILVYSAESQLTAQGRGLMRRASEHGLKSVLGVMTASDRVEPSRLSAAVEKLERAF